MADCNPEDLRAVVDMGSNGIRFSISSLQFPTTRIMPTLYQHRVGISLYDAQYSTAGERQPIDDQTIAAVVSSLQQFKQTCEDFEVPEEHVSVLATEATRTAQKSENFRKCIKESTGWAVIMLSKEEEGRMGAMGIASSLPSISGLVMDLGGGSTQLSWIIGHGGLGVVALPEQSAVSMPYGAAAMTRRLKEAEKKGSTQELKQEILSAVKAAFASLDIPTELQQEAEEQGGFTLYLSGGGFRGWGYVLMSRHQVQPYPIPVINGFKANREQFHGIEEVKAAAQIALHDDEDDIFRISERRANQVPAVAFLIDALAEALPQIKEVRFCQGGVREGHLFSIMAPHVAQQHPLVVATECFGARQPSHLLVKLLLQALPPGSTAGALNDYKSVFTVARLQSFANLMFYHAGHSKDLQAMSALCITTSGLLGGVHGILHEDRTLLALLLCGRWGGDVPPSAQHFKRDLERLVDSPWTIWWINYIGAVAQLIARVYPASVNERNKDRMFLETRWSTDEKRRSCLSLQTNFAKGMSTEAFGKEIKAIEKVGKKKNWIGGKEGTGHRVNVDVCIS